MAQNNQAARRNPTQQNISTRCKPPSPPRQDKDDDSDENGNTKVLADEKKEKVYFFVDYANTYQEAQKQFQPYRLPSTQSNENKKMDQPTTSSQPSSDTTAHTFEQIPRLVLNASYLECICTRFEIYKKLPKEQSYLFVSHRPGLEEQQKHNKMFQKLEKKFTVIYHERIETRNGFEKEKGVDVNIAVHIVDTIGNAAKENQNIRIILVSSDADFKPVVEYAIKKNIPIDVWCWDTNALSPGYREYLENNKKLYFLNRYLYQIGFPEGIIFEYQFEFSLPTDKREEKYAQAVEAYDKLSHYAISKRLTEETATPKFETYDFQIFWGKQGFTIAFRTEESRDKFKEFLTNSRQDKLVSNMNRMVSKETLHSQRPARQNEDDIVRFENSADE